MKRLLCILTALLMLLVTLPALAAEGDQLSRIQASGQADCGDGGNVGPLDVS